MGPTDGSTDGTVGVDGSDLDTGTDGVPSDGRTVPPCMPSAGVTEDTVLNDLVRAADGSLRLTSMGEMLVALADGDGDGVPDVADDFPSDPSRTGLEEGLVLVMDPATTATESIIADVEVRRADIYFLFDNTGSMGGELAELQTNLTSGTFMTGCSGGILGAIECVLPDARFGVGRYSDYPVSPYGSSACGDAVFEHLVAMTGDPVVMQTAVDGLEIACGEDGPEGAAQALSSLFTGLGIPPFLDPATPCADGGTGFACFRPRTRPVVVLMTDAPFHEGPTGFPYAPGSLGATPIPWSSTAATLVASGAKVISLLTSSWPEARDDVEALADVTGSYSSGGARFVVELPSNGAGLATAIVDGMVELANYGRVDVSLAAVDDPSTPALDESALVENIVATSWGPGTCSGFSGATLFQCATGSTVRFAVSFDSAPIAVSDTPTVVDFDLELSLDGSLERTIPVRLVVPALRPLYPNPGGARSDLVLDTTCGDTAQWAELEYDADLPAGTELRFSVSFAQSAEELDAAAMLDLPPVTSASGTLSLTPLFEMVFDQTPLRALRVRSLLSPSADGLSTPTLRSLEARTRDGS